MTLTVVVFLVLGLVLLVAGAELLVRCVVHEPPPEMDVPPVRDLPNDNPMLRQDGRGGYRSAEESGVA